MTGRTVHQLDRRGRVRDWLVAGPWFEPADDLGALLAPDSDPWEEDGRWVLTSEADVAELKESLYARRPLILDQPLPSLAEGGEVGYRGPMGTEHSGHWQRIHVAEDGLVDWSGTCPTPVYRLAIAGTVLEADQAEWRTLHLESTGPAAVYVGGECAGVASGVSYLEPQDHTFRVRLASGATPVLVASWQVGFRDCHQSVRLSVDGPPVSVVIPSDGADERIARLAEQILDTVGLPATGMTSDELTLTTTPGVALRLSWPGGDQTVRPRERSVSVPIGSTIDSREFAVRVMIDDDRSPIYRDFHVVRLPEKYRGEAEGGPEDWRAEFINHVENHHNGHLARALVTGNADLETIDRALRTVEERADGADIEVLGLMHLWHRVEVPSDRIATVLRGAKYWIDQPGLDAMPYSPESRQIAWHAAEALVGELWPDEKFANAGWDGSEHARHGQALALDWIERKLVGGFGSLDPSSLAIEVLALVSIVEFSTDRGLVDAGTRLLDKLLFGLAISSWRGIYGLADSPSSRMDETAPISWVCWGTGALNDSLLPAAALVTAQRYHVPEAIRAAGGYQQDEWLGRQHHAGRYQFTHDLLSRPYSADLTTYRTPHAMLSCVEDYRPGLPRRGESVWTVTLGPEAKIFAKSDVLPRARQYRGTVIALYPEETYLWCPLSTLDEWLLVGPWIAGRYGDGYVALGTEEGVKDAASLHGRSWVITVGSTGTFDEFVAGLGRPDFDAERVTYRTSQGHVLRLGWSGPFTVDGNPVGFDEAGRPAPVSHVDTPLCRVEFGDTTMVIAVGELIHTIDLSIR